MDAGTLISDWNKLGALVKDARSEHGWSQAHLADRASVSRSWIAKLEAGHRGAELEQILRLLSALDLALSVQPVGVADAIGASGERGPDHGQIPASRPDPRVEASRRRSSAWAHARALSLTQEPG